MARRGSSRRPPRPRRPKPPNRIFQKYGQDLLAAIGPVVPAQWCVTVASEQHLVATGNAVPPPVVGAVLVDTGATRTCISVAAASSLGLRPTRLGTTHGAGGEHKNPVYPAMLRLLIADRKQQTTSINHQGEFMGIPDLEQSAKAFGMKTEDGVPLDLVGLIGRDLLRYAKLSYDGLLGKLEIQFNLTAINR